MSIFTTITDPKLKTNILSVDYDYKDLVGYTAKNKAERGALLGVPLYAPPQSMTEAVVREAYLSGTNFINTAQKAVEVATSPAGAVQYLIDDMANISKNSSAMAKKMEEIVDTSLPRLDRRKKDFVTSKLFKASNAELQALLIQDNYPAYQKLAKIGGTAFSRRGIKIAQKRIAKRGKKSGKKRKRN